MVGKVLGGRYELLEKIGAGGMAVVYRAKCLLLNRTVAVKILKEDLDSSEEFLKRFNIEAQSAAALTNQHIVSIHDVGKDDNINYIVMEYVEGVTLKEYIKAHSPIDWQQAVKMAMGIADALSEAHKKHIIHRDIKPQNIIVTTDGNVKVTDFGIARMSSGATISVDGDVLGSVHYLSPEQARGGYVDERSDIYSLGVVIYEMLTGKVPFDGDTPVAVAMKQIEQPPVNPCEIVNDIPENVSAIVLKAMSKETASRYSTVTEMYDDLGTVLYDPHALVIDNKQNDELIDEATKKLAPVKIENLILDIETGKLIRENDVIENTEKNNGKLKEPHRGTPENKKEKKKISKGDKKAIIAAAITSCVIVVILSLLAVSMLFPKAKEEVVPDLSGMTLTEAEKTVNGTIFTVKVKTEEIDDSKEDGTIIDQYPSGGLKFSTNKIIEVTIAVSSDGFVELEEYVGMRYDSAQRVLEAMGMNVVVERQTSSEVEVDKVLGQKPAKGAEVKKGATITLFVSSGEQGDIIMPALTGKTLSEAKKILEENHLVFGTMKYVDSDKGKDIVVSQDVTANSTVSAGTIINLTVSNSSGASGSSGKTKSQVYTRQLPDKDEAVVVIYKNGVKDYESIEKPRENRHFDYIVSGSGIVTIDVYIDDKKVETREFDFR